MIIAQLNGGLGNQLFQYTAAKALSLHHKVPLLLDISSFFREKLPDLEVPRDFELYNFKGVTETTVNLQSQVHNTRFSFIQPSVFQKILPKHKRSVYTERFYHFDNNFFRARKNVLLKGAWQSEKYFLPYKQEILDILQLNDDLTARIRHKIENLHSPVKVAVHVRRNDYLRKQIILEWHGVLSADYYKKAFDILSKRVPDFQVFYFSDDIEWVKKELVPVMPGLIVSKNISETHYEDLFFISQCDHAIIANSSFSWWGAWLNRHPDKIIIAPERWFDKAPNNTKDLIPPGWIHI